MAFYQNSVLNKYLKGLNPEKIHEAYTQFKAHFHNPEVQQNIRASKEEQYQEGFLRDLFVNVLGYTLNPNAGFNITTEYKNVKDSKKADGAILLSPSTKGQDPLTIIAVSAIIELKGTETTDLDKVEPQAFGYKNNQPECTYIIISNFEKLRFYIDNAIEHLEFNLFSLSEKEFELLWICLAYESIASDLPKKIKNASLSEEDSITKNLYKDYSHFKRELHQNLVLLNPEMDELLLFKKSQKLLDRFLFLLFAEDRQLLPPNSVREILKQWNDLKDMDVYLPLYSRFKTYFGYLNTGHKGKHHDIFAYNGGLFKTDEVLDVLQIDDDLLYKHTMKLSDYDFVSEVDVNILGHIFENSLNELDELTAAVSGQEFDKSKTKRKRDGIVYTPKYITRYIVDNTVGKLCEEKKAELGLKDEDFAPRGNDPLQKKVKQALHNKLTVYREWLLQISICDPACGSGAFLVEALDFLIREHRYIDELQAKLFGDTLILSDVEKSILENNLFGVDINEESVEIAKLSLWLRTAQPYRKLNDLNNNIKCGNSLIDDPVVAGDKAFNWQKEFPQVFGAIAYSEPFLNVDIPETPDYLQLIKLKSLEAQQKAEQGIALSKEALEITRQLTEYAEKLEAVSAPEAVYQSRKIGFDVVIGNPPYVVYIQSLVGKKTIEYLFSKYNYAEYNPNTYALFTELGTKISRYKGYLGFIIPNTWMQNKYFSNMRLGVYTLQVNELVYLKNSAFQEIVETIILLLENGLRNTTDIKLTSKIIDEDYIIQKFDYQKYKSGYNPFVQSTDCVIEKLDACDKIKCSAIVYRGLETRDNKKWISESKTDETYKQILLGKDVNKYNTNYSGSYVRFIKKEMKSNANEDYYNRNKILMRRTGSYIIADIDFTKKLALKNLYLIIPQDEKNIFCILAQLNSKLFDYYHKAKTSGENKAFAQFSGEYIESFPCRLSTEKNIDFEICVSNVSQLNKKFLHVSQKFQRMLQRKFNFEELPGKLQNWYTLTYKDFVTELGRKKIKFTLAQEAEWEDYFTAEQTKALEIKSQIDLTDAEINCMVYELYELTEEEIKIVESVTHY